MQSVCSITCTRLCTKCSQSAASHVPGSVISAVCSITCTRLCNKCSQSAASHVPGSVISAVCSITCTKLCNIINAFFYFNAAFILLFYLILLYCRWKHTITCHCRFHYSSKLITFQTSLSHLCNDGLQERQNFEEFGVVVIREPALNGDSILQLKYINNPSLTNFNPRFEYRMYANRTQILIPKFDNSNLVEHA